jgi:hypothetical protein
MRGHVRSRSRAHHQLLRVAQRPPPAPDPHRHPQEKPRGPGSSSAGISCLRAPERGFGVFHACRRPIPWRIGRLHRPFDPSTPTGSASSTRGSTRPPPVGALPPVEAPDPAQFGPASRMEAPRSPPVGALPPAATVPILWRVVCFHRWKRTIPRRPTGLHGWKRGRPTGIRHFHA